MRKKIESSIAVVVTIQTGDGRVSCESVRMPKEMDFSVALPVTIQTWEGVSVNLCPTSAWNYLRYLSLAQCGTSPIDFSS